MKEEKSNQGEEKENKKEDSGKENYEKINIYTNVCTTFCRCM